MTAGGNTNQASSVISIHAERHLLLYTGCHSLLESPNQENMTASGSSWRSASIKSIPSKHKITGQGKVCRLICTNLYIYITYNHLITAEVAAEAKRSDRIWQAQEKYGLGRVLKGLYTSLFDIFTTYVIKASPSSLWPGKMLFPSHYDYAYLYYLSRITASCGLACYAYLLVRLSKSTR